MRVKITYIASSGNRYNLISNGIRHKKANYHDWEWKPEATKLQYGERLAGFFKDAGAYETDLQFYGPEKKRQALIDALHDDFELDIRTLKPGRLIWGDYYLDCFIRKSTTAPDSNPTWTSNKVEIYAPYPFWIQELKISLGKSETSGSGFLDFPYDFPYDYTAPVVGSRMVKRQFPFESEFEMVIFGPAVNPRITINDQPYVLLTTIPASAYAVIKSKDKTIMLYENGGVQTNIFDFRNKTDSVFKRIPKGNLLITWDASFGVDLTIFHERSEPRIEVTS